MSTVSFLNSAMCAGVIALARPSHIVQ
jgi:hypothetical protein